MAKIIQLIQVENEEDIELWTLDGKLILKQAIPKPEEPNKPIKKNGK